LSKISKKDRKLNDVHTCKSLPVTSSKELVLFLGKTIYIPNLFCSDEKWERYRGHKP